MSIPMSSRQGGKERKPRRKKGCNCSINKRFKRAKLKVKFR
jgi:hypothetical protein